MQINRSHIIAKLALGAYTSYVVTSSRDRASSEGAAAGRQGDRPEQPRSHAADEDGVEAWMGPRAAPGSGHRWAPLGCIGWRWFGIGLMMRQGSAAHQT